MKNKLTTSIIIGIAIVLAFSYITYNKISYQTDLTLDNVKQIAQVAAVEYKLKVSETIDYSGNKIGPITIPGTKKFYIAIIKGTVVAGIDLNKLKKIERYKDKVIVYLPKAEVLHVYTDPSSKFEKYYEGIFADIKPEEITTLEKKANKDLRDEATLDGILAKANENTKRAITALFNMAGIKTVIFK